MSQNYVPLFDKMGTQPGNNHSLAQGRGGRQGTEALWGGNTVLHTKLVSNAPDEDFQTGRTKAPIITIERPQSVDVLLDSKDRVIASPDNPFDFRASLNSNLYRSRFMRIKKTVLPKAPNINKQNNILRIISGADVVTNLTIPIGFYTPVSLANEIQLNATANVPGGINFTCVYDDLTKTMHLTSAGVAPDFFISSLTNFVTRGKHLVPFQTHDETAAGNTVALIGSTDVRSGIANMLYCRYVYLCSESFNAFSFSVSRTSNPRLNEDVLDIVDLTNTYSDSDWAGSSSAVPGYHMIESPRAPTISLRNPQRNLNPQIDAYILDEYGDNYNELFDLGAGYPPNQIGFSTWMEVTF